MIRILFTMALIITTPKISLAAWYVSDDEELKEASRPLENPDSAYVKYGIENPREFAKRFVEPSLLPGYTPPNPSKLPLPPRAVRGLPVTVQISAYHSKIKELEAHIISIRHSTGTICTPEEMKLRAQINTIVDLITKEASLDASRYLTNAKLAQAEQIREGTSPLHLFSTTPACRLTKQPLSSRPHEKAP